MIYKFNDIRTSLRARTAHKENLVRERRRDSGEAALVERCSGPRLTRRAAPRTPRCLPLSRAQAKRRAGVLAEAIERATEKLGRDGWEALREMSVLRRTLGDANEYEDPDTGNRFYRMGSAQATSLAERAADAAVEAAGGEARTAAGGRPSRAAVSCVCVATVTVQWLRDELLM